MALFYLMTEEQLTFDFFFKPTNETMAVSNICASCEALTFVLITHIGLQKCEPLH